MTKIQKRDVLHVDGFFHGEKNGKGVGRMYGIALIVVVGLNKYKKSVKIVSYKVD